MRARDFSTHPEPSRPGLGLALAGALVFAVTAQQACAARSTLAAARSQVVAARQRVADVRASLERRGAGSSDDGGAVAPAFTASAAPPSQVLRDLVALLPSGVRLDGLGLTYGRTVEIDLQVVARGARDYDELIEGLTRSARFDDVQPGPERREGEVRASVRARYRAEAGR